MKLIVEASFPLEPLNTYVRKGVAGERIGGRARAVRIGVIGGA